MSITGRFAPSPTGPLHFGSLVSAVGSYLEAKVYGGKWLIRIEDIDAARCKPYWSVHILQTLEALGFEWDGEVVYQSQRLPMYEAAIEQLKEYGLIYSCGCSRKEITDSSLEGIDGHVYKGICRNGLLSGHMARALRLLTDQQAISFVDKIQGEIQQSIENEIGDFVIKRADGFIAYQLAVVVDDWQQGITQIIRGADLLLSTPRQIYLQKLLRFETPIYGHLPVVLNEAGEKLSKQTGAMALDLTNPAEVIRESLQFLGHDPPADLALKELWQWAFKHWKLTNVPRLSAVKQV